MSTIKKNAIPENSLIQQYLPSDYSDSFKCSFVSSVKVKSDDIMIAFWTMHPKWVKYLFELRNILVKPFKLNSDKAEYTVSLKECIQEGKSYESVSIPVKSEEETILCMKDKHLTYYLSVLVEKKENQQHAINVTTLVNFHNRFGRFYFIVIYPFHLLVVKSMIKYVVRKCYHS